MYDCIVIGGGVVGCAILDSLSGYKMKCLLLEKEDDVSCGASRANSGIVHAGYDCEPGTLKAKFNVEGSKMYPQMCKEMGVPFVNTGSIVVANKNGLDGLKVLEEKGKLNGVEVKILSREETLKIEPNISDDIEYSLYAPFASVVSPYKFVVALADRAIINGAEIELEKEVISVKKDKDKFVVKTKDGKEYTSRWVVNAAGGHGMEINQMVGAEVYEQSYRRGDYYVLDLEEIKNIKTIIFPLPDEKGKGVLVLPTADGNVLYGPTSIPIKSADSTDVTAEGLEFIRSQIAKAYKKVNLRKVIRLFAGIRSISGDDFIVEKSKKVKNYISTLGICSPGLSSAPAIGVYVKDIIVNQDKIEPKKSKKQLKPHKRFIDMSMDEINDLVKQDSRWGRLICRCEKVTEAEIVNTIHSPLKATTVDAVKRRVRAGAGRCQGGFCAPRVIDIIARELNIPVTSVKKGGEHSEIATGKIKEAGYEQI